ALVLPAEGAEHGRGALVHGQALESVGPGAGHLVAARPPGPVQLSLQHALEQGRPADVAGAHRQDPSGPVSLLRRGARTTSWSPDHGSAPLGPASAVAHRPDGAGLVRVGRYAVLLTIVASRHRLVQTRQDDLQP